jgi:hypothetical protein
MSGCRQQPAERQIFQASAFDPLPHCLDRSGIAGRAGGFQEDAEPGRDVPTNRTAKISTADSIVRSTWPMAGW